MEPARSPDVSGGPLQGWARGALPDSTSLPLMDQCHRIPVESRGPVVTHFICKDSRPKVTRIRTELGVAGGISVAHRPRICGGLCPELRVPHWTAFSGQDPNAGVLGSYLLRPAGNSTWVVRGDGPVAQGARDGSDSVAAWLTVRL